KLLILGQIRNGVFFGIAIRVSLDPVWWWRDVEICVFCFLVERGVRPPGNASIRHAIGLGRFIACCVNKTGRVEGVVEDRVCDQAAGVICLALFVCPYGIAGAVMDGAVADEVSLELI